MKTKEMICELRRLEEAHKNDFVGTGETNWSLMCYDVANRLEELLKAQEPRVMTLCPFRVHGERKASCTISGEYYYSETFMPCLKWECPCYHEDAGGAWCDRNSSYIKLSRRTNDECTDVT